MVGNTIIDFYIHLILSMFLMHVIGDSIFQSITLSMKKRKYYWKDYNDYRNYLYIFYLLLHSFIWSTTIHFSLILIMGIKIITRMFIISYIINILLHSVIDDMKANRKMIGMIIDQFLHSLQILLTFYFVVLF